MKLVDCLPSLFRFFYELPVIRFGEDSEPSGGSAYRVRVSQPSWATPQAVSSPNATVSV